MNHGGCPHAEQHWKSQAANGKEVDHQFDPKGLVNRTSHLSENAQRGNEQGNDDPKDVAAGHQRDHGSALVLAITT